MKPRGRASFALASLALASALACGRDHPRGDGSGTADTTATTAAASPACSRAVRTATLPPLLRETSGLAASRRHRGILWTHTDSDGEPVVYALDRRGHIVGSVRVTGARNLDWEDIALGPCASGDCLYIADTGDNDAARPQVEIYRVPEPAPGDSRTAPAERLTLTYPDGPRDAEALYVLPDTGIYIVSKGRKSPPAVYRVPSAATSGAPLRLARTQVLSRRRPEIDGLVTGADASPDGRWVVIRTYAWLRLYRVGEGGRLASAFTDPGVPLEDAGESQGEAVAFGRGDTIWLSSEAGPLGGDASLGRISCRVSDTVRQAPR